MNYNLLYLESSTKVLEVLELDELKEAELSWFRGCCWEPLLPPKTLRRFSLNEWARDANRPLIVAASLRSWSTHAIEHWKILKEILKFGHLTRNVEYVLYVQIVKAI